MTNDIFAQGQKTALTAAGVTIFFAISKAVVGFFSGSLVLLGDAVHSFADAFSSSAAWLGLKIAKKNPTEKFPYGFYKAENIAAFLISFLILVAGYSVIKESINKLTTPNELGIPGLAIAVAIADAIFMFSVGTYEMKVGRKINSQSLVADGQESRMHLFSSSVVLLGLISALFNIPYLEGIAGIIISLFIFQAGFESIKDSTLSLMDVSPDPEIEKKIKKILNKISGVRGYDNLKLRKSGPFVFGQVQAKIGKSININKANEIAQAIEKEIKKEIKTIDSFTISFKPFETEKQKICIPIKQDQGLESEISSHFGRAPFFLFVQLDRGKVKNYYSKQNPSQEKQIRAGLQACDFVIAEKVDAVITKEMGPISLHTLRDNIVDVFKGDKKTVKQLIEDYSQKKLKPLQIPTRDKG